VGSENIEVRQNKNIISSSRGRGVYKNKKSSTVYVDVLSINSIPVFFINNPESGKVHKYSRNAYKK
jgi:hypothetical protein